ncbi:MAG: AMP-binding protein [Burkholderiaceae bacterium]
MSSLEVQLAVRGKAMREAGLWVDKSMDDFLAHALEVCPDKEALVGYRIDRDAPARLTYRQLADRVNRAAAALHRLDVRHGEVVAVQLPNWWEFVVTTLACGRIGAVMNPLMHIFRERELAYMLGFSQAKVFIAPNSYRGFDFATMAKGLEATLPDLEHVVIVDGDAADGFEQILQAGPETSGIQVPAGAKPLQPDDIAVLMFTSGTTGSPKGVMHTSNTLVACMNALSGRFGLGPDDIYLASTPVGHMTGYVAVVLIGLRQGGTVIMQDFWEAKKGVSIMVDEKVSYFAGSTPFLNDMCEIVAAGQSAPTSLKSFLCGGAQIPPVLIERARETMGIDVCSLWGMTEVLSGTLTEPARAHEKSSTTDGRVLEGMEVLVVDDRGDEMPVGKPGRLLVKGAQLFLGYYRMPEVPTFDEQGWFDSGDLAYRDEEGYIRISGRTKDVLIRGGENVPVVEIEALLTKHPAVMMSAIVGYPDERLGERACAFVVLRQGRKLTLEDVQSYMAQSKVAKQYWPEKLVVVEQMPATPSGKIQKFKLKEMALSLTDATA